MSVVVEHQGELYSLIVDGVGEVLTLYDHDFENHPPTMSPGFGRSRPASPA